MTARKPLVRAGLWTAVLVSAGFVGFAAIETLQLHVPRAIARVRQAPDAGAAPAGAPARPVREKVKITFTTIPPVKAEVRWGKKKLGIINATRKPFFIERWKDSGPIDLVIRAEGFLPLHTRAYTFESSKLVARLTPVTEKHTLFGFKRVPDGGADGGADGGVPPTAGAGQPTDAGAPPLPMGPVLPPAPTH